MFTAQPNGYCTGLWIEWFGLEAYSVLMCCVLYVLFTLMLPVVAKYATSLLSRKPAGVTCDGLVYHSRRTNRYIPSHFILTML